MQKISKNNSEALPHMVKHFTGFLPPYSQRELFGGKK
jgi:hypothetical protein